MFRDAVALKVAYGFGLRRTEAAMLDVADFGPNPHAAEFGEYGVCHVRFGKAMKGSPPKRRSVLTVWGWVPEVLAQWVGEARPLLPSAGGSAALWPSERGPRIGPGALHRRLCEYRDALGLDAGLDFHSLRRSYVTHLIEAGWDPLFVQLLSSRREGVRDVQHEPGGCGSLRAGGGYLRSSITQILRRSDACAAGGDARLVA